MSLSIASDSAAAFLSSGRRPYASTNAVSRSLFSALYRSLNSTITLEKRDSHSWMATESFESLKQTTALRIVAKVLNAISRALENERPTIAAVTVASNSSKRRFKSEQICLP